MKGVFKLSIDKDLLKPEGFKELYSYLKEVGLDEEVKVKDIQDTLSERHDFTKGKITGIISRAETNGLIKNIGWGIYKFNNTNNKTNIINEVNIEIEVAIDKIERIIGKNFSNLETDNIIKLKKKIEILKKAINPD